MAIIIEGMDMPKCCGSCEFNNGYRCTRTETVIDRDYEYQERLSDCPLHEELKEWIPVSERLPEKDGKYICTIDVYDRDRIVDFVTYDQNLGWYVHNVTAWMPLPEKYQPEEDE